MSELCNIFSTNDKWVTFPLCEIFNQEKAKRIGWMCCRYLKKHNNWLQGYFKSQPFSPDFTLKGSLKIVTANYKVKLENFCYKVAWNDKWKKPMRVFLCQKYGNFWSISLELFVKHKPSNCEECLQSEIGGSKGENVRYSK